MSPPYKNASGAFYTKSLFWEQWVRSGESERRCDPVFCLYDDKPGLINCQKTFVEIGDPTGYEWAMKYLASFHHWERLMKIGWFQEAFETWNRELALKMKSEAIKRIQEEVTAGTQQSVSAAKYIAERGWEKAVRGRPSASELKGELKRAAQALSVEQDDAERIGLTVINGGKK